MKLKSSLIVLIIIFIDQISKRYLLNEIGYGNSRDFLPRFLKFTVAKNTGGAFSILDKYPYFFLFIGIISIFFFLYICFCPTVKSNELIKTGCAFVSGGTIGNLTDRLCYGAVIDFLDLEFVNFAIFNLADIAINIGVFIICLGILMENKVNEKV